MDDFEQTIKNICRGEVDVLKLSHYVNFKSNVDELVQSLSRALMNANNKLTNLDLSKCYFGDTGLLSLSSALMNKNNKVITLNLSWNRISNDGARSICNALKNRNNKVTTLNLSCNKIGDDGIQSLSTA
jgi:Ran GTPase-activating protein (RanGAP) involved in mRNA processing and transport